MLGNRCQIRRNCLDKDFVQQAGSAQLEYSSLLKVTTPEKEIIIPQLPIKRSAISVKPEYRHDVATRTYTLTLDNS